MKPLAHISQDHTRMQPLDEHLQNTAMLASKFAEEIGESDYAYVLGQLHDIGKSDELWQNYLLYRSGYDTTIPKELRNKGNHPTAGAIKLINDGILPFNDSQLMTYAIIGHHIGLPDFQGTLGRDLASRILVDGKTLNLEPLKTIDQNIVTLSRTIHPSKLLATMEDEYIHLWVRMLYSCLVDADFLDTERFMRPGAYAARNYHKSTILELKEKLDAFMITKCLNAPKTRLNEIRAEILNQCNEAAELGPGIFSLTAPTGGSKTLSSMSFALHLAAKYGKRRVIVAIPFTSIISQNAKVYTYGTDNDYEIEELKKSNICLFGPNNVLENRSNMDPLKVSYGSHLTAQNWFSPIVVTTNVQLFESLLASSPSKCRKLHNIANSVIILDEAQRIPAKDLRAMLSVLNGLVKYFGVTVLICTATQPTFSGQIGSGYTSMSGIDGCTEIIKDTKKLYDDLKRVHYSVYKNNIDIRSSWEEIANELIKYPQVLCVVNSRSDCRALAKHMPEDTIQLSRLMCEEEIGELISKIKLLLREKKPVRVVSTSLIEAGVDIDFPVVWRALSNLDSISQAAGRANREGLLEGLGEVVVYNPKTEPFGEIKIGAQITTTLAHMEKDYFNHLTPKSFETYFEKYYAAVSELDKSRYDDLLVNGAPLNIFSFRTFADGFKLIDNSGQINVFVQYKDGENLVEQLRNEDPNSMLMARLQRFAVNIPERAFNSIFKKGGIENVKDYYILSKEFYAPGKGVVVIPE